jgi:hypothetical protein
MCAALRAFHRMLIGVLLVDPASFDHRMCSNHCSMRFGAKGCEMNLHDNKAKYYRKRAVELRAEAVDVTDEKARELLMEGAKDCEEMAAGREAIALTIPRPAIATSSEGAGNDLPVRQ